MSRGRNLEEPLSGRNATCKQFFDQAARDGHEGGWIGTLDKLEQYFG